MVVILGCAITVVAVKSFIFSALCIIGGAALSGIGIRGGWLCLSWCLGKLQEFILRNVYHDPDLLMEKSYFCYGTPSFNESAYILHCIRKQKKISGYEEVIINPQGNNGKQLVLELPLIQVPWAFEIETQPTNSNSNSKTATVNNTTTIDATTDTTTDTTTTSQKVVVELYLQYISLTRKICVWASKEQCDYIKAALKSHNDSKNK